MNFTSFLAAGLLAAVTVLGPAASADDAAPAPAWKLQAEIEVDSAGVYLDQVLRPVADAPAASHLRISEAPALNQPVTLTREQVTSLARKQQPDFDGALSGADKIRISRRARTLTESEILEQLTSTLQRDQVHDRGELELRFGRPWTPLSIPDDPYTLKIVELPPAGISASFIVRFELTSGRERLAEFQTVLQARLWREILVARSTLRRGQLLANADVAPEKRDSFQFRDPLDPTARAEDGLEVSENVPAGSPLTARSVRQRPLVTRGRLLDAVVQDGALNISLKVEALEDGLAGQMVRVRNPISRRELSGKVMNEQTVLIPL